LKVLLTGGLGYLGGRLAQSLAATARPELTLATRRSACRHLPAADARIVTIDWSSDSALERLCEGMDAVVHLAGMNAAECARHPVAALEFNGMATARLAQAAARQGTARFIYLSSAHVYGAALSGLVDEHTCPAPRHPYATSHRAGEDAVRLACAGSAMTGVIVRLSNAFGAPVDPAADCWHLLTNDLCRQAVTTHRAVLKTAGTQRRDFIPVAEACRAITHLLQLPSQRLGDGLFNAGGAWAPTLLEMAYLIAARVAARLGFQPQVVPGSTRDSVGEAQLEYSVARLTASGFVLRREAVVEELDRLVDFCARQAGERAT
jgi:UDP-glucose 4-epimerase